MDGSVREPRDRFAFVDGIRGLAALTVAVYHAFVFTGHSGESAENFGPLGQLVALGAYGVPIFIVLSGFVLMLPVARSEGLVLRGGTTAFLLRRARRIYPPYLAALVLFLAVIALVPAFRDPQGTRWAGKVPVTWDGVVAHLLMVHNLRAEWSEQVDGPMWSVATEVQMYVLMPFVLLPLWRRLGAAVTLVLAAASGIGMHWIAPGLDGAHFWYVGLFCGGMLVAQLATMEKRATPSAVVAAVLSAGVFLAGGVIFQIGTYDWAGEPLLAVVVCVGLLTLSTSRPGSRVNWALAVLESRAVQFLGLISYSVYLFHSPILGMTNVALIDAEMSMGVRLALMWLVVLPAALAISYVMFLLVERRFLTSHQRLVVAAPLVAPDADHSRREEEQRALL
jgi:peptidoglycan/LPS O-acetylase OafA/YrhL